MRKYISKIILISISIILVYCTKSYCVESGTVRMEINGGTTWYNINVSEAYAECESLNSATSTLGTTQLQAHLTTDADWSAMAIFSVSQYGGATTNAPTWTNGNDSGIKIAVNTYDNTYFFTSGIVKDAIANSTIYTAGLFKEDGTTPKKYMRQWDTSNKNDTGFVGFTDIGTYGWLGATREWGTYKVYPISMKRGLFGVALGSGGSGDSTGASGGPKNHVTFRPVIWN